MKNVARILVSVGVGLCLALLFAGCNTDPNSDSMAGTKGVAAANAPKTQADYYKQQQEGNAQTKIGGTEKKN
jgi:hypothetical protein